MPCERVHDRAGLGLRVVCEVRDAPWRAARGVGQVGHLLRVGVGVGVRFRVGVLVGVGVGVRVRAIGFGFRFGLGFGLGFGFWFGFGFGLRVATCSRFSPGDVSGWSKPSTWPALCE